MDIQLLSCVSSLDLKRKMEYIWTSNKNWSLALAGVAQLVGASSSNWRVVGLIPSQGTSFDSPVQVCMIPAWGMYRRQPINVYFSHPCFSLPLPLSPKAMKKWRVWSNTPSIRMKLSQTLRVSVVHNCMLSEWQLLAWGSGDTMTKEDFSRTSSLSPTSCRWRLWARSVKWS